MSTHQIPVTTIQSVEPHPNADRLDLSVVEGYTCVVKKDEYKPGDVCVYVPPDYNVPLNREEFVFLAQRAKPSDSHVRIKAMNLRGVKSFGLVVPAPPDALVGQCMMEKWGITRYEPPEDNSRAGSLGENSSGPSLNFKIPVYDLEPLQPNLSRCADKPVICTEKVHGQNGRWVCVNGEIHCGSRRLWKKPPGEDTKVIRYQKDIKLGWFKSLLNKVFGWPKAYINVEEVKQHTIPTNNWYTALGQNPWLGDWLRANPGYVVFGEVFGPDVQGKDFSYGKAPGEFGVVVFDVMTPDGCYVGNARLFDDPMFADLVKPPMIYRGVFDFSMIQKLAEDNSAIPGAPKKHVREGIVVKDDFDKYRSVAYKYVSVRYYTR